MSDYKGTYTDNLNLSKDDVDDSYDVGRVNSNSDKIDKWAGEVNTQLNYKMSLFIGEVLPEIDKRDEKTLYFKVTDTISTAVSENLKVSPTMGLKVI